MDEVTSPASSSPTLLPSPVERDAGANGLGLAFQEALSCSRVMTSSGRSLMTSALAVPGREDTVASARDAVAVLPWLSV